jgi:hypothetical protein
MLRMRQRQSVTAAEFAKVLHRRRAQKETGNHLPPRLLNNSLAQVAAPRSDTGIMRDNPFERRGTGPRKSYASAEWE